MKQHIDVLQLKEIEENQKEKLAYLLDNWNEYKIKEGHLSNNDIASQTTVGKMIEILYNANKDVYYNQDSTLSQCELQVDGEMYRSTELCDALWEAVKSVLSVR